MSEIGTPLEIVFAAVLMLGPLITVHELGHFLVAKWCGVRVLKFSIGFGPPIGLGRFRLAWERGGTQYVIGAIPLGGFVKMQGEAPEDADDPGLAGDPGRSLLAQPTWRKLAIVFAGPAMNLALPVVIFMGFLAHGVERPEAVVGTVEPGSPAARAGIETGDRITALGGEPIAWWDEFGRYVREHPGDRIALELERDGQPLERELAIRARPGIDLFFADAEIGWLGLRHTRQRAILGLQDAGSPAARAGLRSGDRVTAVGDTPVESFDELRAAVAAASGSVSLHVERGDADAPEKLVVDVPGGVSLADFGLIPAVVLVQEVSDGMPAQRAGIEPGDLLLSVDGEPIGSFATFRETVLSSGGRPLEVRVARAGVTRTVTLAPERAPAPMEGVEEEIYLIGIAGENALLPGPLGIDQVLNPLVSFPRAVLQTAEYTTVFAGALKRLVSGEISRKNIGGPIEIAKQSHQALERGWGDFLMLAVMLSINLGLLNLLPIPILDGGQAVVFAVEGIKRSPLSLRSREFVLQIGFVLLVMLMGFAFWNDISRNWSSFVDWMKGL